MTNFACFILLFFLLVKSPIASSQVVAVETIRSNSVLVGMNFDMNIVAEGIPCENLTVMVDQGQITYQGPCQFAFMGTKVGTAIIQIFNGEERLSQKIIRVRRWPDPEVRLGGKSHGPLGLAELKAQVGLIAWINNMDIDARAQVIDYQVSIIRNREAVFVQKNTGGRFSSAVKRGLQLLKRGDQLVFTKIRVMMPGESVSRELGSLTFHAR